MKKLIALLFNFWKKPKTDEEYIKLFAEKHQKVGINQKNTYLIFKKPYVIMRTD
jgi:hypothetical protein